MYLYKGNTFPQNVGLIMFNRNIKNCYKLPIKTVLQKKVSNPSLFQFQKHFNL